MRYACVLQYAYRIYHLRLQFIFLLVYFRFIFFSLSTKVFFIKSSPPSSFPLFFFFFSIFVPTFFLVSLSLSSENLILFILRSSSRPSVVCLGRTDHFVLSSNQLRLSLPWLFSFLQFVLSIVPRNFRSYFFNFGIPSVDTSKKTVPVYVCLCPFARTQPWNFSFVQQTYLFLVFPRLPLNLFKTLVSSRVWNSSWLDLTVAKASVWSDPRSHFRSVLSKSILRTSSSVSHCCLGRSLRLLRTSLVTICLLSIFFVPFLLLLAEE